MAYEEYGVRFTEGKYATKLEVANDLHTPLIDGIWKKILEYRKPFTHALPLFSIDKSIINFCLCNSISGKINSCEMRLINLLKRYSKLNNEDTNDLQLFDNTCYVDILKKISSMNNFDLDDNYLSMVANKKINDDSQHFKMLTNYVNALNKAKKIYHNKFDEDMIAELYSTLIDNYELTYLYRNHDSKSHLSMVNPTYEEAPYQKLDKLMLDLCNFVNNSDVSYLVKAMSVFYYINYIKPFEKSNKYMSFLLAKIVLAKSDLENLAFDLNIESILVNYKNSIQKVFLDVQKSNDLTYLLIVFLDAILQNCEYLSEIINNLTALQLKNEYYEQSYQEANIKKEEVKQENHIQAQLQNELSNIESEKPIAINKEKPSSLDSLESKDLDDNRLNLAINILPPSLSEKELQRLEEDLLESDPELKRGQAYFYVRHCTIGKRYTISQYKKELSCAYETARTSMDLLAKLGYYRQEMVKNKKVYTPVRRK